MIDFLHLRQPSLTTCCLCPPRVLTNGTLLYFIFKIALLQRLYPKRCTIYASHSPIHTHIHTRTAIGCHARYQPAHQEQSGVRCLAQGHFDMPGWDRTGNPPTARRLLLPPEPHRPRTFLHSENGPAWRPDQERGPDRSLDVCEMRTRISTALIEIKFRSSASGR